MNILFYIVLEAAGLKFKYGSILTKNEVDREDSETTLVHALCNKIKLERTK